MALWRPYFSHNIDIILLFALAIKIARRHTFGLGHQPSLLYQRRKWRSLLYQGEDEDGGENNNKSFYGLFLNGWANACWKE